MDTPEFGQPFAHYPEYKEEVLQQEAERNLALTVLVSVLKSVLILKQEAL